MRALFTVIAFLVATAAHAQIVNVGASRVLGVGIGPVPAASVQLSLDLVANTGNVAPGTALTVVRAGTANVQNTSGGLSSVSANTLRLGADEIFNQGAGVWIEEAATNAILSPGFTGCTTGLVGSGGTLPTGWARGFYDGTGYTITITSCAPFTFTLAGTASGQFFGLEFMAYNTQAASVGQTWTCSSMLQVSSTTGISRIGMGVLEYTNATTLGVFTLSPMQVVPTDIPWFTQAQQVIVAGPTVSCGIVFQSDPAGTVNATVTVARPQFEQRIWRSTFAASTRAADVVALAPAYQTAYLAAASRAACLQFDAPRYAGAGTLWSERADANNLIELRTAGTNGATALSLVVISGGSTLATVPVGVLSPLSRNKVCIQTTPTGITTQLMGKAAVTTALTPPGSLTLASLGSGQNGSLNSTVQALTTWTRAISAAEMTAAVTSSDMFDDFDRANSASLGTAPTGQAWGQTGLPVFAIASNFMATNGAVGATYAYASLGRNVVYQGTVAAFLTGTDEASAALIAANGPMPPNPGVTTGNHPVFSTTQEDFGRLTASGVDIYASYIYPTPITADGSTLYGFGVGTRTFDTSTVEITPGGALVRYQNALITDLAGPFPVWEAAGNSGTPKMPKFRSVSAR